MDPSPTIDDLLKHYLTLLDKYSTLRADLSRLQTATFQHLARANFTAERGLRFGPDHYDERMQALRRAQITDSGPDSGPTLHVVKSTRIPTGTAVPASEKTQTEDDAGEETTEEEILERETSEPTQPPRDPIRWFGLLTPLALRQTQACAVEVVERVVPQLVTVEAEMRRVEIEVRRARKRRAKAVAAAAAAAAVAEGGGAGDKENAEVEVPRKDVVAS